jgi:hypothetical protein
MRCFLLYIYILEISIKALNTPRYAGSIQEKSPNYEGQKEQKKS